jgi:hypothetical protein
MIFDYIEGFTTDGVYTRPSAINPQWTTNPPQSHKTD